MSSPKSSRTTSARSKLFSASTGRDRPPVWSLRSIQHECSDLTYAANYSQIKGKEDLRASKHQTIVPNSDEERVNRLKRLNKQLSINKEFREKYLGIHGNSSRRSTSPTNQNNNQGGIALQKYIRAVQRKLTTANPQRLALPPNRIVSQFLDQPPAKDFTSQLLRRPSHHLDFSKQPNRPQNIYKIEYNPDFDYNHATRRHHHHKIWAAGSNTIHDFQSYSPRRVFEPKPELDKYYDWEGAHTSFRKIDISKVNLNLSNMVGKGHVNTERREPFAHPRLEYKTERAHSAIKPVVHAYDMAASPKRNIKFTKQIVCQRRGTSR